MSWLDLHMHSLYSDDGEFTPTQLMEFCLENGVRTAAVCDHNSVRAVKEAQYAARRNGVTLIPGIEMDCACEGTHLHVLGYFIDPAYPEFAVIEERITKQYQEASPKVIQQIQNLGIYIDEEKAYALSHNNVITGEILAEVALEDARNDNHTLLIPYRSNGTRSDNPFVNFYWDYCSHGKPGYVPTSVASLEDVVRVIHAAGGVAILAHPGNNIHEDEAILTKILAAGVIGIEVYSSYHSETQVKFYEEQAEKHHVIMTVGSDYHGKTKPSIKLGGSDCKAQEQKMLDQLFTAIHA